MCVLVENWIISGKKQIFVSNGQNIVIWMAEGWVK
jgi:hypothetical protein